jgi:selenocysteine lyase/cysteine desulfurase
MNSLYENIVRLINAKDRSEIALCDSATTAFARAFYSIPLTKGK